MLRSFFAAVVAASFALGAVATAVAADKTAGNAADASAVRAIAAKHLTNASSWDSSETVIDGTYAVVAFDTNGQGTGLAGFNKVHGEWAMTCYYPSTLAIDSFKSAAAACKIPFDHYMKIKDKIAKLQNT